MSSHKLSKIFPRNYNQLGAIHWYLLPDFRRSQAVMCLVWSNSDAGDDKQLGAAQSRWPGVYGELTRQKSTFCAFLKVLQQGGKNYMLPGQEHTSQSVGALTIWKWRHLKGSRCRGAPVWTSSARTQGLHVWTFSITSLSLPAASPPGRLTCHRRGALQKAHTETWPVTNWHAHPSSWPFTFL